MYVETRSGHEAYNITTDFYQLKNIFTTLPNSLITYFQVRPSATQVLEEDRFLMGKTGLVPGPMCSVPETSARLLVYGASRERTKMLNARTLAPRGGEMGGRTDHHHTTTHF